MWEILVPAVIKTNSKLSHPQSHRVRWGMVSGVLKNEVCTTFPSSLRKIFKGAIFKENFALLGILQCIPVGKNFLKNLLARKWRPTLHFNVISQFYFYIHSSFIEIQFTFHKIHLSKVHDSVVFSIHRAVQPAPLSNFRTFSPLQKETLCLLTVPPPFSPSSHYSTLHFYRSANCGHFL